jgi:hypothetical protein
MTRHAAPRLGVREIQLLERDVRFRMPFRFGVVTLTGAPEAFLRVRIALEDGREGWGMAAEMLAPKWFDKDPKLSNEDNFDQLRSAVGVARDLYLAGGELDTAFGWFATRHPQQVAACAARGLNPLVAGYGTALIDRAILDALLRLTGLSFFDGIRANLPGLHAVDFAPETKGFDFAAFLSTLRPEERLNARHTVGMVDPITAADQTEDTRLNDGLPETLEEVVKAYGHRYFKLKVGGSLEPDMQRLLAIAAVLDDIPDPYYVSLDGNEQYESVEGIAELWSTIERTPELERLAKSILFIEQPINRKVALDADIGELAARRPVIIDESDADFDAFPRARALGYRGISSKTCKGLYRSLVNAARCVIWNREEASGYFMSAEDLTTQAGVSVQQDLALVSLIGCRHVERNGHHYVRGMAGIPEREQRAFLTAHPDLYREVDGVVCLRIEQGQLAIRSLACEGFAAGAEPEWPAMRHMGSRQAAQR